MTEPAESLAQGTCGKNARDCFTARAYEIDTYETNTI